MFAMGSTLAVPPGASLRGGSGFSQVHSDAEHHAAWIDERVRLIEGRDEDTLAHQRVGHDALGGGVIERIEDVAEHWQAINDETGYSVPADLVSWSSAFLSHLPNRT